jgi:hypothetical protein
MSCRLKRTSDLLGAGEAIEAGATEVEEVKGPCCCEQEWFVVVRCEVDVNMVTFWVDGEVEGTGDTTTLL